MRRRAWTTLAVILLLAMVPLGHWLVDRAELALLPHGGLAPFVRARDALSEETEVLFLGSSHTLLGVRPDLFRAEAMSMAGPGWDYRTLEAVLGHNLGRVPNLRLAVIEFDLLPMFVNTSAVLKGRCKSVRVWGVTRDEVPCEDREVGEGTWSRVTARLVPDLRITPWGIWGMVRPRFTGPEEHREPVAGHRAVAFVGDATRHGPDRIRWLGASFSPSNRRWNRAALIRVVERLRRQGVEVVLVTLPHQEAFSANVPAAWRRELTTTLNRLRRRSPGRLPLWDFERSSEFVPRDFMDSVHLNVTGMRKLSARLDARIEGLLRDRESLVYSPGLRPLCHRDTSC